MVNRALNSGFHHDFRGLAAGALKVGFQILASDREATTVTYDLAREALVVDRSRTSAAAATTPGILTADETGRLRLFDVVRDGARQVEALELLLVVDNAILEVHANDRFALGTWVRYVFDSSLFPLHAGEGMRKN